MWVNRYETQQQDPPKMGVLSRWELVSLEMGDRF